MYVVDTNVYANEEDFSSSCLNENLLMIKKWFEINKLSLNVNKTNLMIFRKKHIWTITILKYLKVMCSTLLPFNTLTWKTHVSVVSSKISKIYFIKSLQCAYPETDL